MFRSPLRVIAVALVAGATSVAAPASAVLAEPGVRQCAVTVTSLGEGSYGNGINDRGDVAGQRGARTAIAAVWDKNGVATDLTGLPDSFHNTAHDVNNAGQAVGVSIVSFQGASHGRPVVWDKNGRPSELPLLTDAGGGGGAWAINSKGTIVGGVHEDVPAPWGGFMSGPDIAVVWTPKPGGGYTITRLAGLPGMEAESHRATDINDAGQVVGIAGNQAVTWDKNGTITALPNLPGSTLTTAEGINNSGVIVGMAVLENGQQTAVVWTPTPGGGYTITDLGRLPGARPRSQYSPLLSRANEINERGQIVGISTTATGEYHAVLWTPTAGGGYTIADLGTLPGDSYSEAFAINNQGQVSGRSVGTSGQHVVRWDTRC